jgi:hypothetical protein
MISLQLVRVKNIQGVYISFLKFVNDSEIIKKPYFSKSLTILKQGDVHVTCGNQLKFWFNLT